MMGLGLRAYPLLILLALSQFAGAAHGTERSDTGSVPPPRAAPPEDRTHGDRHEDTPCAAEPAPQREPALALLLLLKDAAARWHME